MDKTELGLLYEKHYKALVSVARKILRKYGTFRHDEAHDVVQQAFIYALGCDFRGECKPFSFLFRLTQNEAFNVYRKRLVRKEHWGRVERRCPRTVAEELLQRKVHQETIEPDSSMETEELFQATRAAIFDMPEPRRTIATRAFLQGKTINQIRHELGLTFRVTQMLKQAAAEELQKILTQADLVNV